MNERFTAPVVKFPFKLNIILVGFPLEFVPKRARNNHTAIPYCNAIQKETQLHLVHSTSQPDTIHSSI